ncbi:MAG: hypothetical protein RIR10_113 [Planctomycetota bacterium]|jgi:uncharacterized membrane protein (DUF485 family)
MSRPARANRLGLVLFTLYCIAYAAFVLIAAFGTFENGKATGGLAREMPSELGGLSWGIVGGFGLIVGAFVIALIYAAFAHHDGGDA